MDDHAPGRMPLQFTRRVPNSREKAGGCTRALYCLYKYSKELAQNLSPGPCLDSREEGFSHPGIHRRSVVTLRSPKPALDLSEASRDTRNATVSPAFPHTTKLFHRWCYAHSTCA